MANYARFKKYLIACLGLWFFMLFGLSRMFISSDSEESSSGNGRNLEKLLEKTASPEELKKIRTSLERIDKLQKENDLLQKRLQELKYAEKERIKEKRQNVIAAAAEYLAPTKEFEYARRRLENGITEFWRYASTHLKQLYEHKTAPAAQTFAKEMLEFLTEHRRVILKDIEGVEEAAGILEWKKEKADQMTKIVQNRLKNLQTAPDCTTRKRIYCSINKACGFGCQIHHATYCLIAGYALNRTVILESKNWRYSSKGWESVFLPLTKLTAHCGSSSSAKATTWRDDAETEKQMLVEMPIVDNIASQTKEHQRPMWLPLAVPDDLFPKIHAFHKNPPLWWMGQIVSYLWRLQPQMKEFLDEKGSAMEFQSPVVGVHVRRTDKVGTEAARHEIDEYMKHVEEYYNQLEVTTGEKISVRRVFIATDEAGVFQEAKTKFPAYEIIGDPKAMETAALNKRYTDESLRGIISDVHFLSQSDHLVCTFSSQVCRLAYEIMQTRYPDATDRYNSLDDVYYYGGQNGHNFEAVLPHEARNPDEISFAKGDLLAIAGNHWDGYSVANHLKTGTKGKFPSFKADEHFVTYRMPKYEDRSDL